MLDDFLRQAMKERAWSIPRLAEACDVNPGLVARWVSKNARYRVTPGPASCKKIAAALGLDPDYVLELAGHREHTRPREPVEADTDDPVDQAIRARMKAFESIVRTYPKAVRLSVIEANIKMAELFRDMTTVTGPGDDTVSEPTRSATTAEGSPPDAIQHRYLVHPEMAPALVTRLGLDTRVLAIGRRPALAGITR